jgi:hypothetical protein
MSEQGHHQNDQVGSLLEVVEGRPFRLAEGLTTVLTDVAPFLLTMDADIACTYLASSFTVGVGAELFARV